MKLPRDVEYIISSLNAAGYRADVVGGPVRDFLLGAEPSDYDITTSATPEEIKRVFLGCRTVDTGIIHGTVSLILGGVQYEITTYRVDGEYLDARHPESVSFTDSLSEDLARRDFTMNAICYNPKDGITDLYGGIEDIKSRIIHAVGEPDRRFSEDALRILRGVRFASVLGFGIEDNTALAMSEKRELLRYVSAERIYTEWKKLLSGKNAYAVLERYSDVIAVFLPEICTAPLPDKERFLGGDYLTRLLSLFALCGSENPTEAFTLAMKRLKTDKAVRLLGSSVLSAYGNYELCSEMGMHYALMQVGEDALRALVRTEYLTGRLERSTEDILDALLIRGVPYRISDLEIGGEDLTSLGFCGREVGATLAELLRLVVSGEICNEREKLLSFAPKLKK